MKWFYGKNASWAAIVITCVIGLIVQWREAQLMQLEENHQALQDRRDRDGDVCPTAIAEAVTSALVVNNVIESSTFDFCLSQRGEISTKTVIALGQSMVCARDPDDPGAPMTRGRLNLDTGNMRLYLER